MTPHWARLTAVLQAHAPEPRAVIAPGDRLVQDLGFDSLAIARTVVALESEFATELPADRLHELRTATAGDLAALLDAALAA